MNLPLYSLLVLELFAASGQLQPPIEAKTVLADAAVQWVPGERATVPTKAGAGREFTARVRLKSLPADGTVEFVHLSGPAGPFLWRLALEGVAERRLIQAEVRVPKLPGRIAMVRAANWIAPEVKRDVESGLFRVAVPVSRVGRDRPLDLVVRRRGPVSVLELFVDGVLVDTDWPIGLEPVPEDVALTIRGPGIDQAALWNRALSEDEITALAGGAEAVARRDREIQGPDSERMPYWRPRGYNAFAGDCMPFVHDQRFHLFYLVDRRHHSSRWWYGAHQWAHVSSADLKSWTKHPLALSLTKAEEGSICTGSVVFHAGKYHAFYDPRLIGEITSDKGGVFRVESADGIHFDKTRAVGPLSGVEGGDAEVIWSEPHQKFYLITRGDKDGKRQIFFYSGTDLDHWKAEPCPWGFAPNNCDCPHYFVWNGRHYFFASKVARTADRLEGPWADMPRSSLGVPKTVAWKENRRLVAGFYGDEGWGGDAVLHELVQLADGTLGEKFVPELLPTPGQPVKLGFSLLNGKGAATQKESGLWVTVDGGVAALAGLHASARVTMRVGPRSGAAAFGIGVRADGKFEKGVELRFDAVARTARFGICGIKPPTPVANEPGTAMHGLDKPFQLDLILGPHGLVDACIDERYALITRGANVPAGANLVLFVENGSVDFEAVRVYPLTP